LTESGHAARVISKYRPSLPILAFTPNIRVARELNLVWGVRSVHHPKTFTSSSLEQQAIEAIKTALERGFLKKEDVNVLIVAPSAINHKAGVFTGIYNLKELHI